MSAAVPITREPCSFQKAALTSLPTDLGEFMSVLSDLARRLQPLGQMAERAGEGIGFVFVGRDDHLPTNMQRRTCSSGLKEMSLDDSEGLAAEKFLIDLPV